MAAKRGGSFAFSINSVSPAARFRWHDRGSARIKPRPSSIPRSLLVPAARAHTMSPPLPPGDRQMRRVLAVLIVPFMLVAFALAQPAKTGPSYGEEIFGKLPDRKDKTGKTIKGPTV